MYAVGRPGWWTGSMPRWARDVTVPVEVHIQGGLFLVVSEEVRRVRCC